jgi:hypothetical protein
MTTVPTGIGRFGLAHLYQDGGSMNIPPASSRPTVEGSAVVIYPQPLSVDGEGYGCKATDSLYAIIKRPRIPIQTTAPTALDARDGLQWYLQYYSGTVPTRVYVELYDMWYDYTSGDTEYHGGWRVFKGIMGMPVISNLGIASTIPTVRDFSIQFTELEVA